jgi:hypothetical protein
MSKFKDVEIEESRMWKLRDKLVQVIIGALETVKKGLDRKHQVLPGRRSAK